ncbi:AAA family ATPase [Spirillospora sp. CA-294931]|uniref:AAA family ATPase n=1 Tax=Spirillospora sp. CA-294931 TaxID=3240042 RepID=UPI003D90AF1A
MSTKLRLLSLTVRTAVTERNYDFNRPLTVVTGPVGAGKSSLFMLMKHAMGGNATLTPTVREHVTEVDLYLELENRRLVLRRSVPDRSGRVEVRDPFDLHIEESLPVRSSEGQVTLSDRLLGLLSIPQERIPSRSDGRSSDTVALTFNNLLAYLYIEAREIDSSIAGHLDTFRTRARRAMFELLFGLTDSELNELRRRRGRLGDVIKSLENEVDTVQRFLEDAGTPTAEEITQERTEALEHLASFSRELNELRSGAREQAGTADPLVREIEQATVEEQRLGDRVHQFSVSLNARRSLIAQLELDRMRLNQASVASRVLGPFEFVLCPRCFQSLTGRPVSTDQCVLCMQPEPGLDLTRPNSDNSGISRLEEQTEEARRLMSHETDELERLTAEWRAARLHLDLLRDRASAAARDRLPPILGEIERLSARHASVHARIERLSEMGDLWQRVQRLQNELSSAKVELRSIKAAIKHRIEVLAEHRTWVTAASLAFSREIDYLAVPGVEEASIDTGDFLPRVNGGLFEEIQASGGGVATAVHLAYSFALTTVSIDINSILLPSILIIDSPRKAIGQGADDIALSQRIYRRIWQLAEGYGGRIQLIIGDNSLPPQPKERGWGAIYEQELSYENPMVPGVRHPGPKASLIKVEDQPQED